MIIKYTKGLFVNDNITKRKKYLIDKKFQFNYISTLIILQIIVAVCVSFAISYIFLLLYTNSAVESFEHAILPLTWAVLVLISGGVFCAWAIKYTNRIAGPVFHMRRLLQEAAEGNIPEQTVKFRNSDHFKDLEEDLTNCFSKMREYKEQAELEN